MYERRGWDAYGVGHEAQQDGECDEYSTRSPLPLPSRSSIPKDVRIREVAVVFFALRMEERAKVDVVIRDRPLAMLKYT
jgi:hypothetical protein